MYVINATNPDNGLHQALWHLKSTGVETGSRNGKVVRAPTPVATVYHQPNRRVLLSPLRDANPFFHLYEAIWMLAGNNDAASVSHYANTMNSFADDNGTLWGAYGFRWREFFGFDQLESIVNMLRKDPTTRRAVLTMWAPNGDLEPTTRGSMHDTYAGWLKDAQMIWPTGRLSRVGDISDWWVDSSGRKAHWDHEAGAGVTSAVQYGGPGSKDVPCNTTVYFDPTLGKLDMMVCNRSNDIVWGCYGANMVHMSILHEFVARASGLPLGTYTQMSNNFHMYADRPDVQRLMRTEGERASWAVLHEEPRPGDTGRSYPLMDSTIGWERFLAECSEFTADPTGAVLSSAFLRNVAQPMMVAHAHYKAGDTPRALYALGRCNDDDWRRACEEWLERRAAAKLAKAGVTS